jgi:hypothetical protein
MSAFGINGSMPLAPQCALFFALGFSRLGPDNLFQGVTYGLAGAVIGPAIKGAQGVF